MRNKLDMGVLSVIKKGIFKDLYEYLSVKGKPFKVKAVAVMRKIILLANTLVGKGEFIKITSSKAYKTEALCIMFDFWAK